MIDNDDKNMNKTNDTDSEMRNSILNTLSAWKKIIDKACKDNDDDASSELKTINNHKRLGILIIILYIG